MPERHVQPELERVPLRHGERRGAPFYRQDARCRQMALHGQQTSSRS
jgi:hypothetical protein